MVTSPTGSGTSRRCEEIDEAERAEREAASLETMRERFAEPHPDEQVTHPSLRDESTD